ncbi:MAG: primosomal protein N', partial [Bdellovibrionales bacterium]|nr:primosomal protein N' [Bdellovibrionales bacterium]
AVDAPIAEALTYLWTESFDPKPGLQVMAPLGKRKVRGVLIEEELEIPTEFKLKPVSLLEDEISLPESHLKLGTWLSEYYIYPLGQVLRQFFPPLKKTSSRKRKNSLFWENSESTAEVSPSLNPEQQKAVESVLKESGYNTHLLLGVTGSGKTEVYLNILDEVLKRGQSGLVLVPEIALTPQLVSRFSKRFPNQVAVIHSQLTERERTDQWWSVVEGSRNILIGARSALFCPLPNLGLIVVDEEHEPSFKQDEKLRYHGRDAAVVLGSFCECPVVLGSATPSLESWQNVKEGKYHLHELKLRATESHMPDVHVIDLRDVREHRRDEPSELPFWLSDELYQAIDSTLKRKEQVALFLNRRGLAQMSQCPECGFVAECPNCAVSLTVHQRTDLVCHYCGYTERQTKNCPSCHVGQLAALGLGTELVESDLLKLFPQHRVARADRDEIQNRKELEDLIQKMEGHEIDILVGTQMIAKGLDFPLLTCVGLVLADVGFHWPDFRATERSYQLLTQVTGRSGRHSVDPGQVFIQTYSPTHQSVTVAQSHQIEEFYQTELVERKDLNYPPFSRVALFKIQGNDKDLVTKCSQLLAHRARQLQSTFEAFEPVQTLGPAPAPLSRLRGKYRFQVLLKAPKPQMLKEFCRRVLGDEKWIPSGTKVQVDIDPLHML